MAPGRALTAAVGVSAAYGGLQWLGRTYGATRDERRQSLPGDDVCRSPQATTTHAITIGAPPERVWPWLVQMGWGRGQWYTARWVDRLLFPDNGPSADRLVQAWQDIEVGDRILDGPPDKNCGFDVVALERDHHLVLRSREHLPPKWHRRYGATMDWTWTFVLHPLPGDRTRFLFRSRFRLSPWWIEAFYLAVVVPADFVMSRQMLRGVRRRSENTTSADLAAIARSGEGPQLSRCG